MGVGEWIWKDLMKEVKAETGDEGWAGIQQGKLRGQGLLQTTGAEGIAKKLQEV